MDKLDDMTIKELQDLIHDLSAERKKLKAQQLKVVAALDKKLAQQSLLEKLDALSSAERALLNQYLEPNGIDTEETFGKPGTKK